MQTVNDAYGHREIRRRIEELKTRVEEAAAAEDAGLRAKASSLSVLRKAALAHEEQQKAVLDAAIQAIRHDCEQRASAAKDRIAARAALAQRALHGSKAALSTRLQEVKDRRIGWIQASLMRSRQDRETEVEHAVAERKAFQKLLIGDRDVRRGIRKEVLSALRSYRTLADPHFAGKSADVPSADSSENPEKTRALLLERLAEARVAASGIGGHRGVRFFRWVPVTLVILGLLAVFGFLAFQDPAGFKGWILPFAASSALVVVAWGIGWFSCAPWVRRCASALNAARVLEAAADRQSADRLAALKAGVETEKIDENRSLGDTFRDADEDYRKRLSEGHRNLEARHAGVPATLARLLERRIARLDLGCDAAISEAKAEFDRKIKCFETGQDAEKSAIEAAAARDLEMRSESWRATVAPIIRGFSEMESDSAVRFPAWATDGDHPWESPQACPGSIRIGRLRVDLQKLCSSVPAHPAWLEHGDGGIEVPVHLAFPDQASLLLETDGPDDGACARILQAAVLRILSAHPAGRVSFLVIDPVGLGKDFAGLMHLADYEEQLISSRIWTQPTHIEERLAEVNEHIEKVIQMYLRDEYPDIDAYNAQAGVIAEKHRFVVISGFPSGFSDGSLKRLRAIASGGPRCGVHLLIHRDTRRPAEDPSLLDELRHVCLRVASRGPAFALADFPGGASALTFDPAPSPPVAVSLVHRIGRASVDSNRVQVPFSQIAPPAGGEWSLDTGEELRVPIGRSGARKLQMLGIGKGTRQHVLVAGKTGSGKSTLFHVIITNLARWCAPDQVEFYLVDFKKGVEFKCYATKRLPHARVVAIESDRGFALSVLQRVDAELKRRGELFRKAGSQDLAGFRRSAGAVPMPRTLLLIDEFQEFFTEDDAIAQEASLLLDRIVRQGRAFGIHVILGSQTLGGAYTLARATLGQMVIRIALQCNESDAHLIMDDDNPAPRLLTRPGEGIYNDQAGAIAANSPFQIVWLPEDERDAVLTEVAARAAAAGGEGEPPIVFEGNAPADVRENPRFDALLRTTPLEPPASATAWLGAPNSIKGPTEAVFRRQSGSHLLVVGQSAERTLSMLGISLASLALQHPAGGARFIVLDPLVSSNGRGWFQQLGGVLPQEVTVAGTTELPEIMNQLSNELARRLADPAAGGAPIFLILQDLQRFKALRPDDEFRFSLDDDAAASPSKVFADLLGEGGACGIHVIAAVDTWNNVSRWIPRKLMAEFEMRVLFQMSANDSANLIDSPEASTLGLHRALFHNEHQGSIEIFRPYAMPDPGWVDEIRLRSEAVRV